MAKYFIDRPIFAWVIAIVIMLAGGLAITALPVAQYPDIAAPTVQIRANYPGASAKTVEDTVTQVIEQKLTGLDYLRYITSQSDATGGLTITLTFEPEADPDIAQVQTQNKLQLAMPLLPQEVQAQGISVQKSSSSFLKVISFYSDNGSMNGTDLSDYVSANILDELARLEGIGSVQLFGAQYAMRIWIDPTRLNNYGMTPTDLIAAIKEQNAQISGGQLGGLPAIENQQLNSTIIAQTRLETAEEFEQIMLRVNTDGSMVRLKDVARVELAGESYNTNANYNNMPATAVGLSLATGANAINTSKVLQEKLDELEAFMPQGMKLAFPYDTIPFVKLSINSVVHTLFEAIGLVFIVMYLFLQNFRATIIPTIAVPVVLLGTFGVLSFAGYSINTLTMFAMVLAIGLLVDDAIVVVENVERLMTEEKLSPRDATRKSMEQITGALIGIAMVLSAVFVPMAFMSGATGVIYRQFSITIVTAMGLSVVVAVIFTPALCATLLKQHEHIEERDQPKTYNLLFRLYYWFFNGFNNLVESMTNSYARHVGKIIRRGVRMMAIYGVLVALLIFGLFRLPGGFLPNEDQGILFTMLQLPTGSTDHRTVATMKSLTNYFLTAEKENVESVMGITGFSFISNGQNNGMAFIKLKDWEKRKRADQSAAAIVQRAFSLNLRLPDASLVIAMQPPPIMGMGNDSGFSMQLVDRGGLGHQALMDARNQLLGAANQHPLLSQVRPNGAEDTPQFQVVIDQEKARMLGLSISDINQTLSIAWGSAYVNDFIDRGRVKKVYIQADAPYRMVPEDINQWYVRNNIGEMVPFSAFATGKWIYGAPQLSRFNGISSFEIAGSPAPGVSSGQAMEVMEELVATKLPQGFDYAWINMSYEEKVAGSQTMILFILSALMVVLCLAALYESWSVPISVIFVAPLGVLGAVYATLWHGMTNDVYFKVALLTVIGLSAKNAILIVEFAKSEQESGKPLYDSIVHAARLRLRPILMTSIAFGVGVLPLYFSSSAGAASQNAVGTGVVGGVVAATLLAIYFVPVFFMVIRSIFKYKPPAYLQ